MLGLLSATSNTVGTPRAPNWALGAPNIYNITGVIRQFVK